MGEVKGVHKREDVVEEAVSYMRSALAYESGPGLENDSLADNVISITKAPSYRSPAQETSESNNRQLEATPVVHKAEGEVVENFAMRREAEQAVEAAYDYMRAA